MSPWKTETSKKANFSKSVWIVAAIIGFLMLLSLSLGVFQGGEEGGLSIFGDRPNPFLRALRGPREMPDDGIRRIGSSELDSDTSECDWQNLSLGQKVRTRFAGRILEFPCTVRFRGRWRAGISPEGEVVEERYYFSMPIQFHSVGGKESIWPLPPDEPVDEYRAAFVSLRTALGRYSPESWGERIKSAKFFGENEDLDLILFSDEHFFYSVVKSELQATGSYAYVACSWNGEGDPIERFFPENPESSLPAQCSAYWTWDESVRVRWTPFTFTYLSEFSELYYVIQQNFDDMKIGEYTVNYELE